MSQQAGNPKDRNLIAVIGDEVRTIANGRAEALRLTQACRIR